MIIAEAIDSVTRALIVDPLDRALFHTGQRSAGAMFVMWARLLLAGVLVVIIAAFAVTYYISSVFIKVVTWPLVNLMAFFCGYRYRPFHPVRAFVPFVQDKSP